MTTLRYKYRFYPTKTQRTELAQLFGCVRVVYNWGLQSGHEAFESKQKRPNYNELSKSLTKLKKTEARSWLKDVSSVPLQQSLRHLDKAWENFFQKRAAKPKFKSKLHKQSATFNKSAMRIHGHKVNLGRITGALKIRWSRELPCAPSSCTVSLDKSGRYHISFVVEVQELELERVNRSIGLDLGLTHFAIASDGTKYDNPKFLQTDLNKLAKAQKALAKKAKSSKRRQKQRLKVAKLHAKVADKRRDFLHKLSSQLIRENQALGLETLSVKNMVKNRRLSRAISDAGWGMFVRMLEEKAHRYGRQVVKIDKWFACSKTCSGCGHKVKELALSLRQWECESCGVVHDRDINAAVNIKVAAGLAETLNARGDCVSDDTGFVPVKSCGL